MASTSYLESVRDDLAVLLEKWVNELVESDFAEAGVIDLLGSIHAVQTVTQQLVATELRARRYERRRAALAARLRGASGAEAGLLEKHMEDLQAQLDQTDKLRGDLTANLSALAAMLQGGLS